MDENIISKYANKLLHIYTYTKHTDVNGDLSCTEQKFNELLTACRAHKLSEQTLKYNYYVYREMEMRVSDKRTVFLNKCIDVIQSKMLYTIYEQQQLSEQSFPILNTYHVEVIRTDHQFTYKDITIHLIADNNNRYHYYTSCIINPINLENASDILSKLVQ